MIAYVTQRVDYIPDYEEMRDALDERWTKCIRALFHRAIVIPVPNDLENLKHMLHVIPPELVILTGGNDLSAMAGADSVVQERDDVESLLVEHARTKCLPLLAVCRGFQLMNVLLGGALETGGGHVATDHEVGICNSAGVFEPAFHVNSDHRGIIPIHGLAASLIPKLHSKDGLVEAAVHYKYPWLGIMWHPERNNPAQHLQQQFIKRFFQENQFEE